jgi:hypothetical protein
MPLELSVIIEGHDWEHDLHYGFQVPFSKKDPLNPFNHYPEYLHSQLEYFRQEMEFKYKKDFIEKKHHINLVVAK